MLRRFVSVLWLLLASTVGAEPAKRPTFSLSHLGRLVAMQDMAGDISLINAKTKKRRSFKSQSQQDAVFTWSADDRLVAVAQEDSIGVYETRNGKLRFRLAGSSAAFAPNGKYVSFIRDHTLYIATSDGRDAKPFVKADSQDLLVGEVDLVYGREFDVSAHYWWAPDASSIAFIETGYRDPERYILPGKKLPLFRLKLADLATGVVRTVIESDEQWAYLIRVAWLPDSKRIAFYRVNRLQTLAELCVFDQGVLITVLTEKDSYWVNAPATPLFVGNGTQVLVTSERSGNRHVYLYGLDGELIRDVTPGDLEVYGLDPGPYVTASTGTRQEQQLFHLDLNGAPPKQVTREHGWHEVNVDAAGDAYLDIYSTAITPPVVRLNGVEVFRTEDADPPVADEFLPIKTHDNVSLPARLYKPDDFDPTKRYPVIMYTFSGPRGRVVRDAWDGWQMAWNREMVRKGFLVLSVDVRGSGGYGHLYEEYIHYRLGAQETVDLREVVSYLRRQTYVDGERLGIWGNDYGAHIAVHAMLQFPGGFKAGFALAPITDWTEYDAYFAERYLGLPARRRTEYEDSGALEDARRMTGTLLVAERPGDPMIRRQHVEALREAMAKVKKPGVEARFKVMTAGPDLQTRMSDFFEQTLK